MMAVRSASPMLPQRAISSIVRRHAVHRPRRLSKVQILRQGLSIRDGVAPRSSGDKLGHHPVAAALLGRVEKPVGLLQRVGQTVSAGLR